MKKKSKSTPENKTNKSIYTPKAERSYIPPITKAVMHPVRSVIIEVLKEGNKSTVELEKLTGENRYNLYHHLNALEQVDFISWKMLDNKTKQYYLKKIKNPKLSVLKISGSDIKENPEDFKDFLSDCERLKNKRIPSKKKIKNVEIQFHY